ncbi:MAG: anthranilate synthase component I family protein [Myxococcales bacterium]|nr:anthranilate synthase component I family protein [Myxococcales bacterium]
MEGRGLWAAASGARLVPVVHELLCDGDTPVGVYARLRAFGAEEAARLGDPRAGLTFLLESVGGGEHWARYSVVGVGCRAHVRGAWVDGALRVEIAAGPGFALAPELPTIGDLAAVEALLAAYKGPSGPELPRFWGGLVGVWGHDMVRAFEGLAPPPHASDLPALEVIASDLVVVFDNFSQRVQVIATADPATEGGTDAAIAAAEGRARRLAEVLRRPPALRARELVDAPAPAAEAAPPYSREGFLAAVARAREHIVAGDIFQVVLSQRFEQPRAGLDPLEVYRILRVTNPAPYMVLCELASAAIAGASPEVLVRVDGPPGERELTVRPIAGTRRRGIDVAEDRALEAELLADPKERAEHVMLVDLGRNDVGRVSLPGSVRVPHAFVIERYSRVMHIVSQVVGALRPELGALDALRATFPAGTLSGAPKIRALEIIDALEPASRGWYGGAVGYLGYDGAADFAICIRSVVFAGDAVRVQAGAGIVYDSDPAAEDAECHAKASAVLRAIAIARADGEGADAGEGEG